MPPVQDVKVPAPDPALTTKRAKNAKKPKPPSRSERWGTAAARVATAKEELEMALTDLRDIQQEYQDWNDNLPENLQGSALGEKLQAVCDLDLEPDLSSLDEVDGIELPIGFGRD